MKIDDLPLFLRRGRVVECLTAYGFSAYEVKIMLADGTIRKIESKRKGGRARYSREQIRRDVLPKNIEEEAARCDTSRDGGNAAASTREVKAKTK